MNYGKDDGTTVGGIFTIAFILLAFVAGYWVRDQGVRFKVDIPQVDRRAK
jgi:hypothetical protein